MQCVLQCAAVYGNVLQCVAVCCLIAVVQMQCVLHCVAVYNNVLQCVAVCCLIAVVQMSMANREANSEKETHSQ